MHLVPTGILPSLNKLLDPKPKWTLIWSGTMPWEVLYAINLESATRNLTSNISKHKREHWQSSSPPMKVSSLQRRREKVEVREERR
ncbi:hypothetical protein ACFX1Q_021734 [Malus domestica]